MNEVPSKYVERTAQMVKVQLQNALESEDGMVKVDYTFLRAVLKSFDIMREMRNKK